MIQLSNLTYYPIKACRGFDVAESQVERMGLANDRRMMVVTPSGKFLTQREYPRLALVTPTVKNGMVTLSAPNFDSLQFGIQSTGTPTPVEVWKSKDVSAIDQGEESAQWLSDWLGVSVRLVHVADGFKRKLNPEYAIHADDHTGFADGYPILIISEESLQDLNSKLDSAVPMNRFRPNIVVKGCEPFAEETWKRIRIGGVEMALVKPCARCVVTTIDKDTLAKSKEPLKTLSSYRMQELGAIFGVNVIPLNEGVVKVGMSVEVLE
ncbi:MAG TPA: MOSC domain-containing protein [Anaerolineales bacterium]|nr:MOSC domain-containing protein [Anaerolineales bacterium]HMX73274.1 MOSC domain-containing protein [Anaerolineales bacterium]HNA54092.1 MOSC domain-containing protein [Anaerolineales bacterium]HNB86544.1 MOSC domain-containing protein [Anaerolineales bacterium]HNF34253.1 MOSC domain-containing protein [Anaerolineales bacterium]